MARPKKTKRVWTYTAASRTLPFVRVLLRDLREGFILVWHLFRIAGNNVNHPDYRDQIRCLNDEGREALAELDRLGVIAYQSPLRGIALFPFVVHEGKGRRRKAFYIYKDSRDSIDSYVLEDDLCEHNDLFRYERDVPEAWKRPGTIPRMVEGTLP